MPPAAFPATASCSRPPSDAQSRRSCSTVDPSSTCRRTGSSDSPATPSFRRRWSFSRAFRLLLPLVRARLAADADPSQALVAGDHLTFLLGRDEDVLADLEVLLGPVKPDRAVATDDDVDLFLAVRGVIVHRAFRPGRQLELVDAECADTERSSHRLEDALLRLDVIGVDD